MASKYSGYLEYLTKMDAKVRKEHAILNAVVKKQTDKFWDEYYPPNGYNCRCRVVPIYGENVTSTNTIGLNLHKTVPEIWRFNAAKEKKVFNKKHPYFKVSLKDKEKAKKNFGMPLPKKKNGSV